MNPFDHNFIQLAWAWHSSAPACLPFTKFTFSLSPNFTMSLKKCLSVLPEKQFLTRLISIVHSVKTHQNWFDLSSYGQNKKGSHLKEQKRLFKNIFDSKICLEKLRAIKKFVSKDNNEIKIQFKEKFNSKTFFGPQCCLIHTISGKKRFG